MFPNIKKSAYCVAIATSLGQAHAESNDIPEIIYVTSERIVTNRLDTPYSVSQISNQDIQEQNFRNLPEVFESIPGILVQKTAYGQGSPYIRGFTGFRTLFLIDGIRLNNSIFREGPNQYWNTVDLGSISKIELVRGASSSQYGADAIGGTVQVFSQQLNLGEVQPNDTFHFNYRGASAEESHQVSAGYVRESGETAFRFGAGFKDFGDLTRGDGIEQPNTGYDEYNVDAKFAVQINPHWILTTAAFLTRQDDVPRTHKTIDSTSFAGTTIGNELRRDLDHHRLLTYAKVTGNGLGGVVSAAELTLSWHSQEESRERLRTGDRFDAQGIETDTLGLQGQFVSNFDWARLIYGIDYYVDHVSSYSSRNEIQGPVADDATYESLGIYVQGRKALSDKLDLLAGIRFTHVDVEANRVSDPNSDSQIRVTNNWSNLVGNLMLNYRVDRNQALHAGVSQGFRAPNLSDLTRFDSARSNEFEIPATDLDAEHFTNFDVGYKYHSAAFAADFSAYYTIVDDQIERVPTGMQNEEGEFEISKENIGDGYVYGAELNLEYQIAPTLSVQGALAYLQGKVDTFPTSERLVEREYISRLMPTTAHLSMRYDANQMPWWMTVSLIAAEKADRLSTRDQSDTDRIPQGGTPGYGVVNFRAGYRFSEQLTFNFTLENLLDKDYRIHGSGQNEAGRNFVLGIVGEF